MTVSPSDTDIKKFTYSYIKNRETLLALLDQRDAAPKESKEREKLNKETEAMLAWHYTGSKIIFTVDKKGNQICIDAYDFRWKVDVLNIINQLASKTKSPEKQALLKSWYSKFKQCTMDEIYQIIGDELQNPKSALRKKEGFLSMFSSASNEIEDFNAMVEKRKTMLTGIKSTVTTGRKFI